MKELPMRDTLAGVGVNYPSAWLLLFWGSFWQMSCRYGIPIAPLKWKIRVDLLQMCAWWWEVTLRVPRAALHSNAGSRPSVISTTPATQHELGTPGSVWRGPKVAGQGVIWLKVVQFFWHIQDNKTKSTILPIPTSSTILLTPFLALIVQLLP